VSGYIATLIFDPAERAQRRHLKRDKVLRWLRLNTWSTADVLREVVEIGSRQAIHALLQGLCREGLIRKATISGEFGPPVLLWGITAHGAAMAARENEQIAVRTFEPSKVNMVTMGHNLDVQRLQLRAERASWTWEPAISEFSRSDAKYADAIAVRPDLQKVAIEVERTVKTIKRYAEILVAHLDARRRGKWDWIYYLSPNSSMRVRVERCFREIRVVTWKGRKVRVEGKHLEPFRFYTYEEEWTTLDIK